MNKLEEYYNYIKDINPTKNNSIYYLIKICAFIDSLFTDDENELYSFLTHIIKEDNTIRKCVSLSLNSNNQAPSVVLDNDTALLIINLYADLEKIVIEEEPEDDIFFFLESKNNNSSNTLNSDIIKDFRHQMLSYDLLTQNEIIILQDKAIKGDNNAREMLVNHNLRLVFKIAQKYLNRGLPFEDILQEGTIGLIKAIDKYNPEKGAFSTYATWWISKMILRSIGNTSKSIRLPIYVNLMMTKIVRLKEKYDYLPNNEVLEKIAKELDITTIEVEDYLRLHKMNNLASLDESINSEEETFLKDFIPSDIDVEKEAINEKLKDDIQKVLNELGLTEREKTIIILRWGLLGNNTLTLEQLGKKFNLTRERIRQIEVKAIKRMKTSPNFKLLDEHIDDIETDRLNMLSTGSKNGIFAYFPKDMDKELIFILVGLLDEEDISLIIRTFGDKLNITPSVLPKKISIIIKETIPELMSLYTKFSTSLYAFLNVSNKEDIDNVISNLPNKDIIMTLYDPHTYKYTFNKTIPFIKVKEVFNSLNMIRIKLSKLKKVSMSKVNKNIYFITKKRLLKDINASDLDYLEKEVLKLKYGLTLRGVCTNKFICNYLSINYKTFRMLEKEAFTSLYGNNRIKLVDFNDFLLDEDLSNLNIYKDLSLSIDDEVYIIDITPLEFNNLIDESNLTLLQKTLLKAKYASILKGITTPKLKLADFNITPYLSSMICKSILSKLFNIDKKISLNFIYEKGINESKNIILTTKKDMLELINGSNLPLSSKKLLIWKYNLTKGSNISLTEISRKSNIKVSDIDSEINKALIMLYGIDESTPLLVLDTDEEKELLECNISIFKSYPSYQNIYDKYASLGKNILTYIMLMILSQNIKLPSIIKSTKSYYLSDDAKEIILSDNLVKEFTDNCLSNLITKRKDIKYETSKRS